MKGFFTILVLVFNIINTASAGSQRDSRGYIPLKKMNSPLYGVDVTVGNMPGEDHRDAELAVAFNGWLYTCFTVGTGGYRVARSIDDGITWTTAEIAWENYYFRKIDLVVTGNAVEDIQLHVAYICMSQDSINKWYAGVERLDGEMRFVDFNDLEFYDSDFGYSDIAIATDYLFPAAGAAPFSLGIVLAKPNVVNDDLLLYTSADGGVTFSDAQLVQTTTLYLRNTDISYGRSLSYPQGRYFLVWEELLYWSDYFGKVYYAFTDPGFNSSTTAPFSIDEDFPDYSGVLRNPVIASSFGQFDNQNGDISTAILFDRFWYQTGEFDICGSCNKNTIGGGPWSHFTISATTNNEIEPDISFDPGYVYFLCTYFDSTDQKLAYLYHDMDIVEPQWILVTDQYNDQTSSLVHPHPQVEIDPLVQEVAHVWVKEGTSGNGEVKFDAEYSLFNATGDKAGNMRNVSIFPNPASVRTNVKFELTGSATSFIQITDATGRVVMTTVSKHYPAGSNTTELDISDLEPGVYLVVLDTMAQQRGLKLVVVK